MQKNQIVELKITDLSYQAMGVAHNQGLTIFVNNALPGEVVQAKILKVKKSYAFAKIEKIEKESPDRIKVKLNQWVQTGLASLAHLKYDKQLEFKRQQVVNLLHKAGLDKVKVAPTLPSPENKGYRNKAQVPVRNVNGQLEIGFFRKHSHDLVPLTNFFTTDPKIDQVLVRVRDILRKYRVPAYDEIHNRGEVRYLDVRRSKATGEIMVILVCLHRDFPQMMDVAAEITQIKGVTNIILNHNPQKTNVIFVDPPRKGLSPEFITAAVQTQPEKIVYISCNPATQIRDLQLFMKQGYSFDEIDPVDMFPQTPHVEAVTVLKRTGR